MLYGELDDARASIKWIADQPEVDASNIFTFGHSAGGVISGLLSIYPDCGAKLTGSAGGLKGAELFEGKVPFDVNDDTEIRLRIVPPNANQIKIKHIAYVGDQDVDVMRGAEKAKAEAAKTNAPLVIESVKGTHEEMLERAMLLYMMECKKAAGK